MKCASISEWITQLSPDGVQQLLADAAARHQDVLAALQNKSQEAELTRQADKVRIERHLMNTYAPDQYLHDMSRPPSTQLVAVEQSVDKPNEEGEDNELKFGPYASEVQYVLDEKWAHIKLHRRPYKIAHATNDIMAIVDDGIISKVGYDSDYNIKATAVLDLFAVAEALTWSSTEFAHYVRIMITKRGFYDKVLCMVHRLDPMEQTWFLQNAADYLSNIFSESFSSKSSRVIINQMKGIISDLEWARDARALT